MGPAGGVHQQQQLDEMLVDRWTGRLHHLHIVAARIVDGRA
jgi:hypothetical protein